MELGITEFAFDFRPKSFNFLQLHRLLELLKAAYSPLHRYFLIYQDEKSMVVQKMIEDVSLLAQREGSARDMSLSNFFLDFRGAEDASYCSSFGLPYFLEYSHRPGLRAALGSSWARGVNLPYGMVATAYEQRTLDSMARNFAQLLHGAGRKSPLEVVLTCDWDADLFASFFELLEVDGLSMPVNPKIEVCYRNVDLAKLRSGLSFMQGTLKKSPSPTAF